MINAEVVFNPADYNGRRAGIERRKYSYTGYIPERRFSDDRRETRKRRSGAERRTGNDRRRANRLDYKLKDRRKSTERRGGGDRRVFIFC